MRDSERESRGLAGFWEMLWTGLGAVAMAVALVGRAAGAAERTEAAAWPALPRRREPRPYPPPPVSTICLSGQSSSSLKNAHST